MEDIFGLAFAGASLVVFAAITVAKNSVGKNGTENPNAASNFVNSAAEKLSDLLFVDVETTGLSRTAGDELVEVAIIDHTGSTVFHSLVNPGRSIPSGATAVHGISDREVKGAPTPEEVRNKVARVVRGRNVIIYNADFDRAFLDLSGAASVNCAMLRFSKHVGVWNDYHGGWRWQSLSTAAQWSGYHWVSAAHRAEADALACRHVWLWLNEPGRKKGDGDPRGRSPKVNSYSSPAATFQGQRASAEPVLLNDLEMSRARLKACKVETQKAAAAVVKERESGANTEVLDALNQRVNDAVRVQIEEEKRLKLLRPKYKR